MIIAVDGPAGSGKSTVAKIIAKKLGIKYLDTGAMFRAVTAYYVNHRSEIDNLEMLISDIDFKMQEKEYWVNGENVTDFLREKDVNEQISDVASNPVVRSFLLQEQQRYGKNNDCIMDGRDIGTVVFPDAEYKFFLTASVEVRAERRFLEQSQQSYEEIVENIKKRDEKDSNREVAPLKKADDAVEVITDNLSIEDVVEEILTHVKG